MHKIEVLAIHHIQLAMPAGQEEKARAFYQGRLGLTEVEKPGELAARGGVWFEGQGMKIHLGVDPEFAPAKKAHPALSVADLGKCFSALTDITVSDISSLPGIERFYVADPFGNRIEILAET